LATSLAIQASSKLKTQRTTHIPEEAQTQLSALPVRKTLPFGKLFNHRGLRPLCDDGRLETAAKGGFLFVLTAQ